MALTQHGLGGARCPIAFGPRRWWVRRASSSWQQVLACLSQATSLSSFQLGFSVVLVRSRDRGVFTARMMALS